MSSAGASGLNRPAPLGFGALPLPLPNSSALDLAFRGRNSARAASWLGGLPPAGGPASNNLFHDNSRKTLPGDSVYYRPLLNGRLHEEESASMTAATGKAGATRHAGGSGLLGEANPPCRRLETLGQVARDSVRDAMIREQSILQAAATGRMPLASHDKEEGSPTTKRRRSS